MPNDNDSKRYVTRQDAFELFGKMRSSTPEEQAAMKRCHEKHVVAVSDIGIFDGLDCVSDGQPIDLELNIFDLGDAASDGKSPQT